MEAHGACGDADFCKDMEALKEGEYAKHNSGNPAWNCRRHGGLDSDGHRQKKSRDDKKTEEDDDQDTDRFRCAFRIAVSAGRAV